MQIYIECNASSRLMISRMMLPFRTRLKSINFIKLTFLFHQVLTSGLHSKEAKVLQLQKYELLPKMSQLTEPYNCMP